MSKTTNIFHVAGNYIAEQHIDIHDNQNVYVGGEDSGVRNQDASDEPVSPDDANVFCRITKEARENGKAKQVEEELRRACVSAPKLIKAIRTNEALGYLDTQNLSSKELYDLLNEHFNLPFTCHNFTVYRSKPIDIH